MHKTIEEGEALQDCILENTPPLEPLRVEPIFRHEEASSAEAKPTTYIQGSSPEPEDPEEGFQPLIFRISRMIFQRFHKYLELLVPKETTSSDHSS